MADNVGGFEIGDNVTTEELLKKFSRIVGKTFQEDDSNWRRFRAGRFSPLFNAAIDAANQNDNLDWTVTDFEGCTTINAQYIKQILESATPLLKQARAAEKILKKFDYPGEIHVEKINKKSLVLNMEYPYGTDTIDEICNNKDLGSDNHQTPTKSVANVKRQREQGSFASFGIALWDVEETLEDNVYNLAKRINKLVETMNRMDEGPLEKVSAWVEEKNKGLNKVTLEIPAETSLAVASQSPQILAAYISNHHIGRKK